MLGEILLGVRPVLARMPEIPCVFLGSRTLNEYDDESPSGLSMGTIFYVKKKMLLAPTDVTHPLGVFNETP